MCAWDREKGKKKDKKDKKDKKKKKKKKELVEDLTRARVHQDPIFI